MALLQLSFQTTERSGRGMKQVKPLKVAAASISPPSSSFICPAEEADDAEKVCWIRKLQLWIISPTFSIMAATQNKEEKRNASSVTCLVRPRIKTRVMREQVCCFVRNVFSLQRTVSKLQINLTPQSVKIPRLFSPNSSIINFFSVSTHSTLIVPDASSNTQGKEGFSREPNLPSSPHHGPDPAPLEGGSSSLLRPITICVSVSIYMKCHLPQRMKFITAGISKFWF